MLVGSFYATLPGSVPARTHFRGYRHAGKAGRMDAESIGEIPEARLGRGEGSDGDANVEEEWDWVGDDEGTLERA